MKQNVWCKFFGLHKFEVFEQDKKTDPKGNVIGLVIISRCSNCGKITSKTIYTESNYGQ